MNIANLFYRGGARFLYLCDLDHVVIQIYII
jgi:hypothetical protein